MLDGRGELACNQTFLSQGQAASRFSCNWRWLVTNSIHVCGCTMCVWVHNVCVGAGVLVCMCVYVCGCDGYVGASCW